MKLMLKLLFATFVTVCLTTLALAQGAATGNVHVSVKDPTGKVVTNAAVVAVDQAKGTARTAPADSNGEYRLIGLAPGQYTITVSAPGFAKAEVKNLAVTVGLMADLPITLSIAGAQEVVTVSSEAELVETSRTSSTDTIDQRRIDNLPINGRNYINFTLTDSQVVRDNAPNIGAAPTSGLNMSGQRARANLVNVDGADAVDNSVNGVRSTVSQEAVQEFQILTNGYAAEYGRASGGVVNIITRSGSNAFHGDVYGYIRNRNFQATNPFSNVSNPAYTRVQAGTAFGGPIKKDKTYYYFSYEVTRRHETGFSSIGQDNFGLVNFDATPFLAPPGTPAGSVMIQVTPEQSAFLGGLTPAQIGALGGPLNIGQYVFLLGTSSGMAVNGRWPAALGGLSAFPIVCPPACAAPSSFLGLAAQAGNFPIFEGTSLYSLRLDHNVSGSNRLMLRANVSPSTVTGIEVNGQNQTFGQNAFSRTSQQTYRDVAGTVQDTWTFGNNKINEFRFQFARRGLSYFFSSGPGGSNIAVNIPGFGYFGREPYSFIDRIEKRYQVTDNFSWAIGRHDTKFGVDYNYIPVTATFTVNYGAVYTFGARDATPFVNDVPGFPAFSPVQAYGLGIPNNLVQGIGNPKDSFKNQPLGLFWQDSWKIRPNLSFNYGVRYDIEFPPKFAPPTGLALAAYNQLGLQKGIQTDKNNFQPRVGLAWDPHNDGKSVFRASYGLFYDHPLLGLYFLGDASDGSKSGQLLFPGASPCRPSVSPNPLTSLNASNIFQGILNDSFCLGAINASVPGYLPNEQRFDAFNANLFLNQNYLSAGFPLAFQPFGYPQAKNFVYAYSHQANLTFEHDLGHNMSMSVAYNFNGGRHLNRPINANTPRGDLLVRNWQAAVAADPTQAATNPLFVTSCGIGPAGPFIPAALVNFFRPSGLNPSVANFFAAAVPGGAQCVGLATQLVLPGYGLNANCDPTTLTNCVPFSDMDANYSNGSSVYHGLTANLRKRFGGHTEFLASYTWSKAIDDSTDLQSPLAPQDSFFPSAERSLSLFDQRHRFVFSGVYQTGRISGSGFASKLLSNWTFAPIVEVASGRPFNILTGNPDNFQFSPSTGRPNVVPAGTPATPCSPTLPSSFSQSGFFQEPCYAVFAFGGTPTLQALDGNFARNGGVKPWTAFNDLRVSRRIYFGERVNLDLIADMFNIANRFNVADVNQIWTNAGQPTASYDPRQFQFAMKVNW